MKSIVMSAILVPISRFTKALIDGCNKLISDACPDPLCTGTMQIYDERVHRDLCDTCEKPRWLLDKETRKASGKA